VQRTIAAASIFSWVLFNIKICGVCFLNNDAAKKKEKTHVKKIKIIISIPLAPILICNYRRTGVALGANAGLR
jgi:hypothetical protein